MKPTLKTTRVSLFALPLAIFGGVATAGGLAEPVAAPAPAPILAPAPVPVGSDWTGFYAGGQLGYGQVEADELDGDTDGATYGVHAGYLYDLGSVVLGGELDLDGTNIENDTDGVAELDTVTRAKLRLGYDAGDWLPYVTAGIAQARVSSDVDAIDGDDTGGFGGLGVEYRLSDSLRIGGEVLRHQFDDFNDSGIDLEATTASARVSFQF